jgi:hypothetical protein
VTELDLRQRRRATPARRRPVVKVGLLVAAGVLLFALGVAFGKALNDRPAPGGTQTYVRTLEPLPQQAP